MVGYGGNDFLYAGQGDDVLYGDMHPSYGAMGAPGDDYLAPGGGNDIVDGSGGTDTVGYGDVSLPMTIDLGGGTATSSNKTDTLSSIENVISSKAGDTVRGSSADNVIYGAGGNDTIYGQGGSDTAAFFGERGNYSIQRLEDGSVRIIDQRTPAQIDMDDPHYKDGDGTDILWDIDNVRFKDGTFDLATIAPPNSVPVAVDDDIGTTVQNTPRTIAASTLLANDTDANGDPLSITGVNGALNGSVSYNSATQEVTFTPDIGYTGLASFTYTVSDGKGGTAEATVNTSVSDGSPLVDDAYYLDRYPDVRAAGVDSDEHYTQYGWREGRDPNVFFSTNGYLSANPDVDAAGMNPLEHYHQYGWREGRDASVYFDTTLYLLNNSDVQAAGVDPLEHYAAYGRYEGRQIYQAVGDVIQGGFDAEYYLLVNSDVGAAGVDAAFHFQTHGWKEGRNPNAYFDTKAYLATYTDVAAASVNPLEHYNAFGWKEGRDPSAYFDTNAYLAEYADVAAAGMNPLEHYLKHGIYEGRSSFGDGVIA
jgi:hypothetical protein